MTRHGRTKRGRNRHLATKGRLLRSDARAVCDGRSLIDVREDAPHSGYWDRVTVCGRCFGRDESDGRLY